MGSGGAEGRRGRGAEEQRKKGELIIFRDKAQEIPPKISFTRETRETRENRELIIFGYLYQVLIIIYNSFLLCNLLLSDLKVGNRAWGKVDKN
ncbi:MAG: hypothetical protein F6J86_09445 [Symploca sp. SIO1B1]|nr:hypothetical protein [Symploca sp. SIO1B1]